MSLGLACAQCEAFYGAAWYWNRERWGTLDGYVPFAVMWDSWRTMQSLIALRQLQHIEAAALATPVQEAYLSARKQSIEEIQARAFPR